MALGLQENDEVRRRGIADFDVVRGGDAILRHADVSQSCNYSLNISACHLLSETNEVRLWRLWCEKGALVRNFGLWLQFFTFLFNWCLAFI